MVLSIKEYILINLIVILSYEKEWWSCFKDYLYIEYKKYFLRIEMMEFNIDANRKGEQEVENDSLKFDDFSLGLYDDSEISDENTKIELLSLSAMCVGTSSGTLLLNSFMTNVTEECSTC